MTNMKPKGGASIEAPSLRGLQGRSATGLNCQAAKEEVSALWREGWMPENISGVPAGRSVFHLTSPFIGLLGNRLPQMAQRALRFRNRRGSQSSAPARRAGHERSVPRTQRSAGALLLYTGSVSTSPRNRTVGSVAIARTYRLARTD